MIPITASLRLNIVIAHYRPDIISGAENSIADFVDQANPRRFRFIMLVPGEGKLADYYRQRGFEVWVRAVETPRRMMPGLHRLQSMLLAQEFKKRAIDGLLCNTYHAAARVATASRMANLPYAIYMRDYLPNQPIQRRMLKQANVLFAISKDVIRQHTGMAPLSHFRLTYNYINPAPILKRQQIHQSTGHRLLPFGPEYAVIGLVGRITPYKQPDLLIRAVPHVLLEVPKARFVIVGSAQEREREYENKIKALPGELGVHNQVAFLGLRKDAAELTSEFSIACLVSGREPLGRVILEANLLNVPVIVPNTGGPAEIVEDGVTGLHFPSQAPDAEMRLAEQIIRLLSDPEQSRCLANKAHERVLKTFAGHQHIEIQEQYIEQLCADQLCAP